MKETKLKKIVCYNRKNGAGYMSNYTRSWKEAAGIDCMNSPPKYLDWNRFENFWCLAARNAYHNGQQYQNVSKLQDKIKKPWNDILIRVVQSLYHSIPDSLASVVDKKEKLTSYWRFIADCYLIW